MSIDRTNYNALADDDGSNTVGSIWNKQAIKNVLLDPIDAALLPVASEGILSTTTGTQNAWNPGGVGDTVIWWAGSADLILNGLAGGGPSRRVTIVNVGTAVLRIGHLNAAAAIGDRLNNIATSAPTLLAPRGRATYAFLTQWNLIAHDQGIPLAVPFAASDFTADGGATWTPAAGGVTNQARLVNNQLFWSFGVSGGSLSANSANLYLKLPFEYAARLPATMRAILQALDGGAFTLAAAYASLTLANVITLQRFDQVTWHATASAYLQASLIIDVQ